jgi:hypothetical protein
MYVFRGKARKQKIMEKTNIYVIEKHRDYESN